MTAPTVAELHTAMEAAIGRAARHAIRSLLPDWRTFEAEAALLGAVEAIGRASPQLSEAAILARLQELGVVTVHGVNVPAMPGAAHVVPVPSGLQ